ncbi:MAG: DUF5592 family protein [Clostridium perfringens]|nr:DUF5592 family protein [Clostridium perfringens]
MIFNIPKDINVEIKVYNTITFFDIAFIVLFMAVAKILSFLVYSKFIFIYYIFCFCSAIFLTSKSISNPKRRNFQSIYLAFIRDRNIYHRIKINE